MTKDSNPHFPKSADPGEGFQGKIGKTLADSMPHWVAPKRPKDGSPNIITILLDDLGFSDFGCFGGEIATPNIDRLAAGGLRFTGYTTVPMCTPARAAMLTGKNPHTVGCGWLTHNNPGYPGYKGGEITLDAPTTAELLRERGYATMAIGKWHNTYDRNAHIAGERSSWPLQRGFDRFYGFLGAETNYFQPERVMEGNQLSNVDHYPEGYFSSDDFMSRLVQWLKEHHSSAPDKPFFAWMAFQAPHTPLQAKPQDLAKYRDRYNAGWDATRAERYARQQTMKLIEDNAKLSPRNPGISAWDELSKDQQALYARYMEVYAALVDNVDQNVGKLLEFLEQSGQLDNTLIMITSDNGANSIGGPGGVMNLQDRRQAMPEDPEVVKRLLDSDRIGGEDTYAAYPTGWTQVSNTPYRYYKRTPMAGGIRVPFVMHWPKGLADKGALRPQWVHVTDILPTILEITETAYPEVFNGYKTRSLDGTSFASILRDGSAPARRDHQHYELEGNRGYIQNGWKIVSLQPPGTAINLDNWMMFDLKNDPTEINDLAKADPGRLKTLIDAFERDAEANYVYPLDNRDSGRAITHPPHELHQEGQQRNFYRGAQSISNTAVSSLIADRSFDIRARFDWQTGQQGVVYSMGDRFTGMQAWVENGALNFLWQRWMKPVHIAPMPLKAGAQDFVFSFKATGQRQGLGSFIINGVTVISDQALSPTPLRLPSGGLDVGINRRQAVNEQFGHRDGFPYQGRIDVVSIIPGEASPGSPLVLDEALVQARMREAARATKS